MTPVTIRISKNGKLQKTINTNAPDSWEQCAPLQAKAMVNTIATIPDEYECKIALLQLALKGVPKSTILSLEDAVILDMFALVDWCFSKDLVTPILQSFRHHFSFYYLPKAKLENISCLEWWLADGFYQKYQDTKDTAHIDKLVGTLCRKKDSIKNEGIKRDDVRVLLHSKSQAEENAGRLGKLDPRLKIYVLYFFSGCKKWVHATYKKYLFPDPKVGEESAEEKNQNPFGWYGIFQQVAESGVFGDLQNILINVKFIDLCAYLVAKKIEQDRIEAKRQKLKLQDGISN